MHYQQRHHVLRRTVPDYCGNIVWQRREDYDRINRPSWPLVLLVPGVIAIGAVIQGVIG